MLKFCKKRSKISGQDKKFHLNKDISKKAVDKTAMKRCKKLGKIHCDLTL